MTTTLRGGQVTWEGDRDEQGHRDYHITYYTRGDPLDGPAKHLQTPGLPLYGSIWAVDNDLDEWAWCRWTTSVKPRYTGEPCSEFELTFVFSTKPPDYKFCQTTQIEDPLLIPDRLSGGFTKYTEEAVRDRFGRAVVNSAHQQLRGQQVEFDRNRGTVKVEQNRTQLELDLLSQLTDTLNDAPMWGLPARCIKFTPGGWERKFQGSCEVYYTRMLEFEANATLDPDTGLLVSGWDREPLDEGTKVLAGYWSTFNQGAGATFNVSSLEGNATISVTTTTPTGFVTGAALVSGGAGYPHSTYVNLILSGPGPGAGCVVQCFTSAGGAVVAVLRVVSGGTAGYTAGATYNTELEQGQTGAVGAAALVSGGANYAPNAAIALPLLSPDSTKPGYDAVIAVQTNAGGQVTSVLKVLSGGLGYLATGAYTTGTATGWVLYKNGFLPDPANPADFIVFKDIHDNPGTVLLNAAGCPISADEGRPSSLGQHKLDVQKYNEADLFVLGLPAFLG